ncbi:MAG: extensin family protein [Deltaproteobacteria bacterium]|nr:extensin family protein [Deltaproteobacteria bacterium]
MVALWSLGGGWAWAGPVGADPGGLPDRTWMGVGLPAAWTPKLPACAASQIPTPRPMARPAPASHETLSVRRVAKWKAAGFDLDRVLRARPAQATWVTSEDQCLMELKRVGVRFHRTGPVHGIANPIILDGPLAGVRYRSIYKRPALMDCLLALALYRAGPVFLAAGFDEVRYWGFYRYRNVAGTHHLSRHAFGLAVDVSELAGPGGLRARVFQDWERFSGRAGRCVGPVRSVLAARMRAVICRIEELKLFRRILTPDSDHAHRDHFHFSAARIGEHWTRHHYAGGPYHRRSHRRIHWRHRRRRHGNARRSNRARRRRSARYPARARGGRRRARERGHGRRRRVRGRQRRRGTARSRRDAQKRRRARRRRTRPTRPSSPRK